MTKKPFPKVIGGPPPAGRDLGEAWKQSKNPSPPPDVSDASRAKQKQEKPKPKKKS